MRLPKMSATESAVLAAAFAREIEKWTSTDNGAAERALETALWELRCFKQAVRERTEP